MYVDERIQAILDDGPRQLYSPPLLIAYEDGHGEEVLEFIDEISHHRLSEPEEGPHELIQGIITSEENLPDIINHDHIEMVGIEGYMSAAI